MRDFALWGPFWALFLDLEIPEPVARTQGPGRCCRRVFGWIICIYNGEIPSIIGVAGCISVMSRFLSSEKLGAPIILGWSGLIGLRFGHVLVVTESCPTVFSWLDWRMSSWRKRLARFCAMGTVLVAISGAGDASTTRMEPKSGGIL